MSQLSKLDITAIRKCERIAIHLSADQQMVRAIKRTGAPYSHDVEHILPASVTIESLRGRQALEGGAASCFALLYNYPNQKCPTASVLRTLMAIFYLSQVERNRGLGLRDLSRHSKSQRRSDDLASHE